MTIDYNLKAQLIDCGLSQIYSKFSRLCFQLDKMIHDKDYSPYYKGVHIRSNKLKCIASDIMTIQAHCIENWGVDLTNTNDALIKECMRLRDSNYRKVKRLKKRISSMLGRECLFLTLTFTDATFAKYNNDNDKIHNLVVRYLKKLGCQISYIANIDYGKENERLHYHALVQMPFIDAKTWIYGNLDFEKVYNKNNTAMAKYICKLTNHAIKETCKGSRIIYSRYKPSNDKSLTFNALGL